MGHFIRVWRREWAGLSREQLAIAVSALCTGRARVTRHAVEAWEEGQPPHSTDELEGLLAVMRRHELTEWEAEDFQRAVYAACLSRQYPELFPDEDFAYRDDVFELAAGLWRTADRPDPNLVALTGALSELDTALRGRAAPRVSRAQRERQAVARAWLRSATGNRHKTAGRGALGAQEHERNAAELLVEFGPAGLGSHLSVLTQRAAAVHDRLVGAQLCGNTAAGMAHACALLRLHEEAEAAGDSHAAMFALCMALDAPLPAPELAPLVERAERSLGTWERIAGVRMPYPLVYLARGSAKAGLLARSEGYLAKLLEIRDLLPTERLVWCNVAGSLQLARGAHKEAEEHFREALGLARQLRAVSAVREVERSLEACDRPRNGLRRNHAAR